MENENLIDRVKIDGTYGTYDDVTIGESKNSESTDSPSQSLLMSSVIQNQQQMIPLGPRDLILTALPLLTEGTSASLEAFLKSLILSRIDDNSLAVESMNGLLLTFLLSTDAGLINIVRSLISVKLGEKKFDHIKGILQNSWFIACVYTLPTIAILLSAKPILDLFDQPDELVTQVKKYAEIMCIAVPAIYFNQVNFGFLKGINRVKSLVPFFIGNSTLGVLLTYLLVDGKFGLPNCGVFGSAWATVLESWLCFFAMIMLFNNKTYKKYKIFQGPYISWDILRNIFQRGLPLSISLALEQLANFLTGTIVGRQGAIQIAINRASQLYFQLISTIGYAIRQGAQINMSIVYGQKEFDKTKSFAAFGIASEITLYIVMSIFYFSIPRQLCSVFVNSEAIQSNKELINQVFATQATVATLKAFQDANLGCATSIIDTFYPSLIKICFYVVLSLILSYLFTNLFNYNTIAVNVASIVGLVISGPLIMIKWNRCLNFSCQNYNSQRFFNTYTNAEHNLLSDTEHVVDVSTSNPDNKSSDIKKLEI